MANYSLRPHFDTSKPFSWVETFAVEVANSSPEVGKVAKTFIKALTNVFGERDPEGVPVEDADGRLIPDTDLTDYENVPLRESVEDYFSREVLPHVPDAYIDEGFRDDTDKETGRVGYEINFNRFFYKYVPPRKLEDIDADLKQVAAEIAELLREITG